MQLEETDDVVAKEVVVTVLKVESGVAVERLELVIVLERVLELGVVVAVERAVLEDPTTQPTS